MSLLNFVSKGVKLVGLREKLDAGGEVGKNYGEVSKGIVDGSFDFASRVLTFRADRNGKYPIKILPYYAGAINYCTVQGDEVVSGPFTGCYMSLYTDSGGTMRCGHVDTAANSQNKKLTEEKWRSLSRHILAERKSTISDAMFAAMAKRKLGANDGFLIGVASPRPAAINFFKVFKIGDDYIVQNKAK